MPTAPRRALGFALAAFAILAWITYFLAPALPADRALLGVDLLSRFPPWEARVGPDWEAANHLLFDQAAQFYPWRLLTRRLQAAGLPPLWNPYAGTGSPLLANQQAAPFAPAEIAAGVLPPERAPVAATAMRLLVAGAGMLALAAALGLGAAGALFAALAFLGSGSLAILLYHPNANVSMWLPLAALLSLRIARAGGGRLARAALLALVMGAVLLGGHPETALYIGIASLLAFAAGRLLPAAAAGHSRLGPGVALLAAAHLAGLLIAAPGVLPFLEYLRDGAVIEHRGDTRFWNPPACVVGLIAPEIYGTPLRPNTYFGPRNYHAVATQYAGMATAVLALVALGSALLPGNRRPDPARRRLALVLGSGFVLALALVYPTPLWRLALHLPLFRVSANVTGLTLLGAFALALLGALGLETVLGGGRAAGARHGAGRPATALNERGVRSRHGALVLLLAFAAAIALGAGLLLPVAREKLLAIGAERLAARYTGVAHSKPLDYYIERLPLVLAAVRATLIRSGLLGIALALLLGPGARFVRNPALLALAFLLHLGVDLAHFGRGYVPAIARSEVFPADPAIAALASRPGVSRAIAAGRAFPPNTLTAYGIEDFRLHDAVGSAAHGRYAAALSVAPFLRQPLASFDPDLLAAAGIDVVAAEPADPVPDGGAFTELARSGAIVRGYERAWPRAFFCGEAQEAASDSAAVAAARSAARAAAGAPPVPAVVALGPGRANTQVAPPGLRRLVPLLYPGLAASPPASLTRTGAVYGRTAEAATERLGDLVHSPLAVTTTLTAPRAGWLVLLDQDYPGWTVAVDGAPARAARAFGLFRAVTVPAGLHTVAWRYEPASFALGLALSAAGLALALGALLAGLLAGRAR
jgi:hypothetical protein